ncbi:MAG TPA: SdrD B-like domain-containing protein, partial [Saprospiraceae bacterium]|nr:SdrD B-like domain-containing protein [Saprospiraceae bacterium]
MFFQPEPAGTQAASMLMSTISPEQAGCTQPTRTVGGASVTFVGVQYDYQVPGRSIWFYKVCSGAMPATSHIVFAFCPEVETSNVIARGTWTGDYVLNSGAGAPVFGADASTDGTVGLKFDQGFSASECRNYYFVLDKNYAVGESKFINKAGSGFTAGNICGPSPTCDLKRESLCVLNEDCMDLDLSNRNFVFENKCIDSPIPACGVVEIEVEACVEISGMTAIENLDCVNPIAIGNASGQIAWSLDIKTPTNQVICSLNPSDVFANTKQLSAFDQPCAANPDFAGTSAESFNDLAADDSCNETITAPAVIDQLLSTGKACLMVQGFNTSGVSGGGNLAFFSRTFGTLRLCAKVTKGFDAKGTVTQIDCPGVKSGAITLDFTLIGLTESDLTIIWSGPGVPANTGGKTLSNLGPGMYTATVTVGMRTCTYNFNITEPAPLVCGTASVTDVDCFGASTGSINVGAASGGNGGYMYSISGPVNRGPQSSTVFNNLPAGNYTITVKDSKGCETTCPGVSVGQPNSLPSCAVTNPINPFCAPGQGADANGKVTLTGSGGTPGATGYTFVIRQGAMIIETVMGNPSITVENLAPGSYMVDVQDANNCSVMNSCSFTLMSPPTLACGTVTPSNASCEGIDNGSLTATATGGTPFGGGQYKFTLTQNGNTIAGPQQAAMASFNNLAAGSYTLEIEDANGCTATCPVTIGVNKVLTCDGLITADEAVCEGTTGVSFTASAGFSTYNWSIKGGALNGVTSNGGRTFTVNADGTDKIEVEVQVIDADGCSITCKAETDILPNPPCDIMGPNQVCASTSAKFYAPEGTGYTYAWSITNGGALASIDGAANQKMVKINAGATTGSVTVQVVVTDANGCFSTCTMMFDIEQNPKPCMIEGDNVVCEGDMITFDGPMGFDDYTWTVSNSLSFTGQGTASITVTVPENSGLTTFKVTLKAELEDGCFLECEKDVTVKDLPTVSLDVTQPVCALIPKGSITANGSGGEPPYVYILYQNGMELARSMPTMSSTFVFGNLDPGTYDVEIEDANDCAFDPPATIVVVDALKFNPEVLCDEVIDDDIAVKLNVMNAVGTVVFSVDNEMGPFATLMNDKVFIPDDGLSHTIYIQDDRGATCGATSQSVTPECFVCPGIAALTAPDEICDPETFDLKATGLTNLSEDENLQQDFNIIFVAFPATSMSCPTNPYEAYYTNSMGTLLGTGTLNDDEDEATLSNQSLAVGTYYIVAMLSPDPRNIEPDCTPSACSELVVKPKPDIMGTDPMTYCPEEAISFEIMTLPGATVTWSGGTTVGIADNATGATADGDGKVTVTGTAPANTTGSNIVATLNFKAVLNGCEATATKSVTVRPEPVIMGTAPMTYCPEDAISFEIMTLPGATVTWSGGTTVGIADNATGATADGDGKVTVTGTAPANTTGSNIVATLNFKAVLNGCEATATKSVTVSPEPVIRVGTDPMIYCPGEAISFEIVTLPGANVVWMGAASVGIPDEKTGVIADANGEVTITGTAVANQTSTNRMATLQIMAVLNNCLSTASKGITIRPEPVIMGTAPMTYCPEDAISFEIMTLPGATVTWSGGTTVGIADNATGATADGDGKVTVTGTAPANTTGSNIVATLNFKAVLNGCEATATKSVTVSPEPVIMGTDPMTYCPEEAISFEIMTLPGATVTWSGGTTVGIADNATGATADGDGKVTVTGTAPANTTGSNIVATLNFKAVLNGCEATATKSVTVRPEPVIMGTAEMKYCPRDAISFEIMTLPGATVTWSGGTAVGIADNATGATADGDGKVTITGTAVGNTTGNDILATLSFKAVFNGCESTANKSVVLHPAPNVRNEELMLSISSVCAGTAPTVSMSGATNLANGDYIVSYKLNGDDNTVTVTFTNGAGSFNLPNNLPAGEYELEITAFAFPETGCSTPLSVKTDFTVGCDYGDLPDTYSTTNNNNGPSHIISPKLYLGKCVDAENDGQPEAMAGAMQDGDDGNIGSFGYGECDEDGNDEDGVEFPTPFIPGSEACIIVTAVNTTGEDAVLQAWIDWNGNGAFDTGEEVNTGDFSNGGVTVPNGGFVERQLCFMVPSTATFNGGQAMTRFRLSQNGDLSFNGAADIGEVEDHKVALAKVGNLVWEDRNNDGIQGNAIDEPGLNDVEVQLTWAGEDGEFGTDDDRTYLVTTAVVGNKAGIYYFCGLIEGKYKLNIDPNQSVIRHLTPTKTNQGDRDDLDSDDLETGVEFVIEQIDGLPTGEDGTSDMAGMINDFPDNQDDQTFDQGYTPMDYGDLPRSFESTVLADGDPAKHLIQPDFYLGTCVDAERDGAPDDEAGRQTGGDDNTPSDYSKPDGVTCDNDENGVRLITPMIPGNLACFEVTATTPAGALLYAWIDFNGNGKFDEGEQVQFSQINGAAITPTGEAPVPAGTSTQIYCFVVPDDADFGGEQVLQTHIRFRLTTESGMDYYGCAPDGEVEDYYQPLAKIGDYTWADLNDNGLQLPEDLRDRPIAGITAILKTLDLLGNPFEAKIQSDENGMYMFTGLLPKREYCIEFDVSTADHECVPVLKPTLFKVGNDDSIDSDANPTPIRPLVFSAGCYTLEEREYNPDVDGGFLPKPTIVAEDITYTLLDCYEEGETEFTYSFYLLGCDLTGFNIDLIKFDFNNVLAAKGISYMLTSTEVTGDYAIYFQYTLKGINVSNAMLYDIFIGYDNNEDGSISDREPNVTIKMQVLSRPSTTDYRNLSCIEEVNVTLDEDCEVELKASQLIKGQLVCDNDFCVHVVHVINGRAFVNEEGRITWGCGRYIYRVYGKDANGNCNLNEMICWGYVNAEDKQAPKFDCDDRVRETGIRITRVFRIDGELGDG